MNENSLFAPMRVLVVDDWPDTAESLAVLLRLWGHDVRIAHDGPTALAVAASYRPDFILLDVGLPGMDGFRVARRMRDDLRLREAFLVSLTGYGDDSDGVRSRQAGCDCHLLKPVDLDLLADLLASQHEALRSAAGAPDARPAAGGRARLSAHTIVPTGGGLPGEPSLAL